MKPATNQDIRESPVRICNNREIAEETHLGLPCLVGSMARPSRMPSSACRRSYDHRLRNLVYEEYDPSLFNDLGVPRSTIASWIRRGPRSVVSAGILALDQMELQAEVISLQRRIRFLLAIIRLAFMLVRLSGFRLDSHRLPDGKSKNAVLRALTAAKKAMPTAVALRVLGLSASRFHNWRNLAQACPLQDRTSCPRSTPA